MSPWTRMEAERAFDDAARARRRALIRSRLRGRTGRAVLPVHDGLVRPASERSRGVREISLDAIVGTVEPNRAAHFDSDFRPAAPARSRWQRVWLAAHRGAALPPISLVRIGDAYAIRDGHHRVSVAKARGALTISAVVA